MNIRYSRRALSQLASVYEYLEERNQSAADNVVASIRTAIARLKEMPLLGKATDEEGVWVSVEREYHYRIFLHDRGRTGFRGAHPARTTEQIGRRATAKHIEILESMEGFDVRVVDDDGTTLRRFSYRRVKDARNAASAWAAAHENCEVRELPRSEVASGKSRM